MQPGRCFPADFNPRSPHGERHCGETLTSQRPTNFNPRSPHGERQPTLPARGATVYDFNPRSPHGERRRRRRERRCHKDFNPRSPHGERPDENGNSRPKRLFQPTLPARGATFFFVRQAGFIHISTHAPRTGSDQRGSHGAGGRTVFQPTLPARGATGLLMNNIRYKIFQPTLPARGATTSLACYAIREHISTHAPRTGSDAIAYRVSSSSSISTHAPRTGSDIVTSMIALLIPRFQPTLPARGATYTYDAPHPCHANFNPRSPHGERHADTDSCKYIADISTHAPRTGSDVDFPAFADSQQLFQPTLPARGATLIFLRLRTVNNYFNPRSPHGERPSCPHGGGARNGYFNPRSPHGERQLLQGTLAPTLGFQPTLPARGATMHRVAQTGVAVFQPTLPARGATLLLPAPLCSQRISTHAPRTGSDIQCRDYMMHPRHFNPRSPHGERPEPTVVEKCVQNFNPRSPHGERQMQQPAFRSR